MDSTNPVTKETKDESFRYVNKSQIQHLSMMTLSFIRDGEHFSHWKSFNLMNCRDINN